MNALVPGLSAENFLAQFEQLRDSLPGDPALREAAAARLRQHGLPGPRDEAWKYTGLRALAELPLTAPESPTAPALPDLGAFNREPRIVFVDGRRDDSRSRFPAGLLNGAAGRPEAGADPIVALNTMLSEGGANIQIPAGRDAGTLLLIHLGQGQAFPLHSITLGAGARLTLLEIAESTGPALHNAVTRIVLADGAQLLHVRIQNESPLAIHLATIEAEIGAGAEYQTFTLTLGARLARVTIRATLMAPRAHASLNAAQRIGGRQHADFTTVVRHVAPDCNSRQVVKNVLADHARAVFQGRIEVAPVAQRTDGYQMNQALLLSPDAEIDSKPELEIFADDVKCSHGATVGALDEDQLFYLTSRGIPREEARSMLVRAFLDDAFAAIPDERLRDFLAFRLDAAP